MRSTDKPLPPRKPKTTRIFVYILKPENLPGKNISHLKTMSYKIYLYDTETDCIGSGTLSSTYLYQRLESAAGQNVDVHISSVGGSAFDVIAIYDLLKKYTGNVTTYIDALAANTASIVAMGGKKLS
ncbi:MAG TPA: ATP-dependent Clp protease proteolytic subunit [Mucilaginibacter sp.]|jgi:ATP-dependent protease ClpP protease subunit|nr:ATP-dependent Clp protease proteolytic subunit [Mucilaginibacter sp.]